MLKPNDFEHLGLLARTLSQFEHRWNEVAEPFDWNFTRENLADLLARLAQRDPASLKLAA